MSFSENIKQGLDNAEKEYLQAKKKLEWLESASNRDKKRIEEIRAEIERIAGRIKKKQLIRMNAECFRHMEN